MASFFNSFRSSNMPKRLLRYALSRLELLDTDALDMDKLDFALGKNTVFTFQDVGIKLQKLESLLNLPPSFELQKAKVLLLRVTVPSAIYTSPIVVEVDGVQVKLRVAPKDDIKNDDRNAQRKKHSRDTEEEEVVPHAIDLAQSFLDTQPLDEKAKLQAALEAESQDLGASVASSEDGSEDDFPLGTGQPLSLPAFLADFLQGIVDRTQVSIKGVTFQLDVKVPVEPSSTVPELVTFQLAIDDINVEGVTTEAQKDEEEEGKEASPRVVLKEGKRHVGLSKIRASLISEANVFSTLARTPSIPSSVATNSPVMTNTSRQPVSRESTSTSMPSLRHHLADSTDLDQSQYHHPLMDSEDAFDIPYDMDSSNGDPDEADSRSAPSTPRALAPQTLPSDVPKMPPSYHPAQSAIHPPGEPWAPVDRSVRSESAINIPHRDDQFLYQPEERSETPPAALSDSDASVRASSDDLERSRMFSHEDAESMYMSAFSQGSLSQPRQTMPGAWDSEPLSTESSPTDRRTSDSVPLVPSISAHDESPTSSPERQSPTENRVPLRPALDEQFGEDSQLRHVEEASGHQGHQDESSYPEGCAADNDTATPKGPTRLVKELVSLTGISIYIPSHHDHINVSPTAHTTSPPHTTSPSRRNLDQSTAPNVPGAFSVYGGLQSTASLAEAPSIFVPTIPADNLLEVILGPLDVRCDLSTGFLLAMVISKIVSALGEQREKSTKTPEKKDSKTKPSTALPDFKIVSERISIYFLEALAGIADTPERLFNPTPALDIDALLTAQLHELTVSIANSQASVSTSVDIGKFNFGYGNDDIISFDQRLQMRASVRDAFPSAGADISATITQSSDATRCEVKTLPLHVKLDLQRLDETFSWFGGLSGFLNMSSSMTSNGPPTPKSPTRTPKKPRGVRFDAPIRPDDVSASSDNKMNMRLGGFRLDLIGKECSVSLDTSAVKLVSREEGLGIGISKIHLAGPALRHSMGDPPISAVITNTRIEYLVTPKDNDLERLLELIIPSKHKFDEADDEIMVDTLLRQRRKGAVLRLNTDGVEIKVGKLQQLQVLPVLGEEIGRLSTVAKYLPEDDRPGILALSLIRNVEVGVDVGGKFGTVQASLKDIEVGHISVPSLLALGISSITVRRNYNEVLVGSDFSSPDRPGSGPVLTMRMIPDEMEPVIKLRMRHLNIEYRVPTIMDILGLAEDVTPQEFEANLAASVANLGEQAHAAITGKEQTAPLGSNKGKSKEGKPTKVNIAFRDCLLGLNPLGLKSKMMIVLTDAHLDIALSNGDDAKALGHLNKASILLIDDISTLDSKEQLSARRRSSSTTTPQVVELCQRGFVDISYISSARVTVSIAGGQTDDEKYLDVELRDDLLVLETCADSTQTLIALANALTPPTPPSKEIKYRTTPSVPLKDLLSSISADAFGKAEGDYDFDNDFGLAQELGGDDETVDYGESSQSSPLHVDSQFYEEAEAEDLLGSTGGSMFSEPTSSQDTQDGVLLTNFSTQSQPEIDDDEELVIEENYKFGVDSEVEGSARRWNSAKNEYERSSAAKAERHPITVRVRDVHVIWNLFDGYDWTHTREVISKAVHDIETTAIERQSRQERARSATDMELVEEETVIGDFLFNSIYIGIPANRDPRELALAINQELNDNATETESLATTAMTATPSRQGGAYRTKKKLKLNRSRRHKITFELKGINVDFVTHPPGSGETQSFVDIRIKDVDVFDHVPTSTWKKFATYDQDAGEREMGASMAHLNIWNVKPVPELAASEIVLKVKFLPLRLHVDQDALDFITRFFEFKDDSAPPTHASPSDVPFVQRAEVDSIPVKLDFKPKRVDYAGLRSGHTTEFMNFIVLDEARMVLRHTIIYGVSGFDRLGQTLNDIWMPDVKRNQLPGILAGLAPVRSIVNVGSGFKDLIEIPIKEYRKDGRIVRSISKGAAAFAKTTGTEIVKLGAKLAVGTQYALQGAEGMLVKPPESREQTGGWDEEEFDEETKQISLYADQPAGMVQGLKGAYSSLARDLNVARDAIIAVPGAVMESQNAQGAAKAVLKRAPTIIFRPLIGSSRAIGQTLMGATNSLDPQNRRRADEKYKKH